MVSILVPVYNSEAYLKKCVDSLIGQTYTDLQIVLINDGSTDGTLALMQELASQDERIEIYSQPNRGVAATRNALLDKVRGDFVLFVDSDDWIELDTIEALMHEQQQGDYDMVLYQVGLSTSFNREQAIGNFIEHGFFRGMLWNKLFRSSLTDGLKLDETISFGEDSLLVWGMLQRIDRVATLKRWLYHYGENDSSLSRQAFNGKKLSSYRVWDSITRDVDEHWPQFSEKAHARFACEMTQILFAAAIGHYEKDDQVCLLQEAIRRDRHLMKKKGVSTPLMRGFAWMLSHNYGMVSALAPVLGPYYRKRYGIN